jgi:hypothetical protein
MDFLRRIFAAEGLSLLIRLAAYCAIFDRIEFWEAHGHNRLFTLKPAIVAGHCGDHEPRVPRGSDAPATATLVGSQQRHPSRLQSPRQIRGGGENNKVWLLLRRLVRSRKPIEPKRPQFDRRAFSHRQLRYQLSSDRGQRHPDHGMTAGYDQIFILWRASYKWQTIWSTGS